MLRRRSRDLWIVFCVECAGPEDFLYLDDVISFGGSVTEALARLEEVLCRLSNFGLQLKAKKCTFMQTEVVFLGHIVGRTGLACHPAKLAAVRNWYAPDKDKGVRQFVGFVGYYRRFVKDFAEMAVFAIRAIFSHIRISSGGGLATGGAP